MTATETPVQAARPLPPVPEAAWSAAGSPRRTWAFRAVLLCVLGLQAALSLRLERTASPDEALWLSAGHAQVDGAAVGAAALAALADDAFGLTGARLLSLCFMLGATSLLYALTRRLFSERVAIGAAALFAVTQSAIVLGGLATHDPVAVFLLALAAWAVVRTDRAPLAAVLFAAPAAVLAVGVEHASALYLPTLVLLAAMVSWRHHGRLSVLRAVLLTVALAGPLAAGLYGAGFAPQPPVESAWEPAWWSAPVVATACGGALAYALRARMNEWPPALRFGDPGRTWRVLLGVLLCGTALIAPVCQLQPGAGLLFAAPMAGIGLTRLTGAHFRHPQMACLLWVVLLCLGMVRSAERFSSWPDASGRDEVVREQAPKSNAAFRSPGAVPNGSGDGRGAYRIWVNR
ncbi:glycosyltransferase family 39 protein [Streptomyces sp. NPDC000410]|uniref:ArnT family glycosyltransferase n=1 Tax=Streptomyces sp. NPDC000410 TaxID=3154254 RepID=UPI0033237987